MPFSTNNQVKVVISMNNINKSILIFALHLTFFTAAYSQKMDTLSNDYSIEKNDTMHKWSSIAFGLNAGQYWEKSVVTGWFTGNYNTKSKICIGISLRVNLGKSIVIGTGFNRFRRDLISSRAITKTVEAPSTITSEPNFLINYSNTIALSYDIIEIPIELTYKMQKIRNHYIPTFTIGESLISYGQPYLIKDFSSEFTYQTRPSGSKPFVEKLTSVESNRYSSVFTNRRRFSPFVSVGLIRELSPHSFIKINAKFVSNQNLLNNTLRAPNSRDEIRSSTIQTFQMGLFAEYFVVF
jgi:hypothetical protein